MQQPLAADGAPFAGPVHSRRIMVVDDDDALRRIIARHLRGLGHHVAEAADANQALAQSHAQPLDLILTDVHMPGLSGMKLARLLLARSPLTPVIVMTGDEDEALAKEALASGATGYLLKPFRIFELDALVRQALSHLELAEAAHALVRTEVEQLSSGGNGSVVLPAVWIQLADEHSGVGAGHGFRVARLAAAIATALHPQPTPQERQALDRAARCHEVGRLLGQATVLWDIAARGAQLLAELGQTDDIVRTIRSHHEHWDGTGGPDGFAGAEIPLTARILAVADAVDHYTAGVTIGADPGDAVDGAIDMVISQAGSIYDPDIIIALDDARSAVQAIWVLSRWPGLQGGVSP